MKHDFLNSLFSTLNAGYEYCVLRNWEGLPGECASRDIDILITKRELRRLKADLKSIATTTECGVLYENWDNQFWTVVYADDDGEVFQLDFQYTFAWMGIDLLREEDVLKHRLFNGRVWHTDPLFEFLPKYLYCRILGAAYPDKYAKVRETAWDSSAEELEGLLRQMSLGWGGLDYWDKAGKWTLRLQALLACLAHRPIRASWRLVCFVVIYVWQLFMRRGWMISFSGPDGCGKSTVIDLVVEKLSVNTPHLFHFRPTLLPNLGEVRHKAGIKKEVDRNFQVPHRAKRCGVVSSLIRLVYYLCDYIVGYWVKIMPLRQRKAIVFFDRYFTDIIVDSERSSIFLNYTWLCWLRHLVPSCQRNFFIRVKPETILSRKQELALEDIRVIYERLEYLAARDGRCVWIDNNGTPEEAARQIILALRLL